jgi:Fe-S-cluster containining protein
MGMAETITGQGRLKIGDTIMGISFTVPAGLCPPQAVLPDVQRLANQVTDKATAKVEAAGMRISCAKGCGACCRQMVPVSPVEARHLRAVVDAMPPERAAAVRERFARARAQMAQAGAVSAGHPDKDKPAYRTYGLAYFRAGVACPFLEDESCSIHPDRPLVCREYLVTSPPAACSALGSGQVRKVAMPVRVWNVFARSVSTDGEAEWMPLIDALAFAETNPEPAAQRTGPQHIDAFLKELSRSPGEPPVV